MMKSWCSSAFDTHPVSQSKSFGTKSTSSDNHMLKPLDQNNALKISPSNLCIQQPKADRIAFSSSKSKKQNDETCLSLAEKYEPKKRADLVVNKSKVDQLSQALDLLLSKTKGSILLIEGPPGSGKSVTLKVLCEEKNAELVVWSSENLKIQSLDLISDSNFDHNFEASTESKNSVNNNNYLNYESQSKLFYQFLYKSSRYLTDQLFLSEKNNDREKSNHRTKKILFVKEIPSFAFRSLNVFHDLLRNFCKYSRYSLVFSLISTSSSSSESNPAKIFPANFRSELNMMEISFNAFANSYLTKELEKIASKENCLNAISKSDIEQLCLTCNGDLRYAINLMEVNFVQSKSKSLKENHLKSIKGSRKRSRAKANSDMAANEVNDTYEKMSASSMDNCSKDINLSIFRGLGKILHRKTLDLTSETKALYDAESKLPKKLMKYKRKPISCDPEEIFYKLPINSDTMTLYLHQNFIEIFAKKSASRSFDQTFESLESIGAGFILSDMITTQANRSIDMASNYNQFSLVNEITALISMRSVLFNSNVDDLDENEAKMATTTNANKIKKLAASSSSSSSSSKGVWMPLHKPYFYKTNELKQQKLKQLRTLLINNSYFQKNLVEMKSEMFASYLPFLISMSQYRNQRAARLDSLLNLKELASSNLKFNRQQGINNNASFKNRFNDDLIKDENDLILNERHDNEENPLDDNNDDVSNSGLNKKPTLDDNKLAISEINVNYDYESHKILNIIDEPF